MCIVSLVKVYDDPGGASPSLAEWCFSQNYSTFDDQGGSSMWHMFFSSPYPTPYSRYAVQHGLISLQLPYRES